MKCDEKLNQWKDIIIRNETEMADFLLSSSILYKLQYKLNNEMYAKNFRAITILKESPDFDVSEHRLHNTILSIFVRWTEQFT